MLNNRKYPVMKTGYDCIFRTYPVIKRAKHFYEDQEERERINGDYYGFGKD